MLTERDLDQIRNSYEGEGVRVVKAGRRYHESMVGEIFRTIEVVDYIVPTVVCYGKGTGVNPVFGIAELELVSRRD